MAIVKLFQSFKMLEFIQKRQNFILYVKFAKDFKNANLFKSMQSVRKIWNLFPT